MAKVLYSATMSLDGFIAGPGGDMSWLTEYFGGPPNPLADNLTEKIGSLLIGARSYNGDDPNRGTENEGPFGGTWSGPQFVLTHQPPTTPVPGITFVDDLGRAVAAAKDAAGDKYVAIIGANVAEQCLAAGLLDEILVFIVPTLLGDGVRLFFRAGGERVLLEPITAVHEPQLAQWLRVRR